MALSPSLARSGEAGRTETARAAESARTAEQAAQGPVDAPGAAGGGTGAPAVRRAATEAPQPRQEQHGTAPAEAMTPRQHGSAEEQGADAARRPRPRGRVPRRPTGRERHDEKITVYVSAEELMDLEHARLVLRGEHGLAVDRGRVVREAIAVVLADLEQRGEASILVRRLRGR
ncbi:hypothetical protein [Kitasatospora camelliae]